MGHPGHPFLVPLVIDQIRHVIEMILEMIFQPIGVTASLYSLLRITRYFCRFQCHHKTISSSIDASFQAPQIFRVAQSHRLPASMFCHPQGLPTSASTPRATVSARLISCEKSQDPVSLRVSKKSSHWKNMDTDRNRVCLDQHR